MNIYFEILFFFFSIFSLTNQDHDEIDEDDDQLNSPNKIVPTINKSGNQNIYFIFLNKLPV
jgi:hypothetical protein